MSQNKRFFAFGCSYTGYFWPTWADIIGQKYKTEYYNYGRHGAGNMFIFNTLMQADQRFSINRDDLVIVQWSSSLREDRYIKNEWITKGALFNYYPESYVEKYFDMRGFLIRDLALIKAAKSFLESTGCKFYFISMCGIGPSTGELNDVHFRLGDSDKDVIDLYNDVLDIMKPSFYDVLGLYSDRPMLLRDGIYLRDSHRITSEHAEYVRQVLPEFSVEDEFVEEADSRLKKIYNEKDQAWYYPWEGFYRGVEKIKLL